jgi:type I restriction enzyme R subunit
VFESDLESLVASRFASVGWDVRVARGETFGDGSTLGRGSTRDAILFPALLAAIERLNPQVPDAARHDAWREITKDRSSMMLAAANREIYGLLRDGIKVETPSETRPHEKATHIVRVIDWDDPTNNRFLLVRQLTVSGSTRDFRPDLVGFVNGLPLLFVELKRTDKRAKDAFDKNLAEYKKHIPQLFWANAIVFATNGVDSRVGSITSEWEHFKRWGRVDAESEPRDTSLDTMVRALFAPRRLLGDVRKAVHHCADDQIYPWKLQGILS